MSSSFSNEIGRAKELFIDKIDTKNYINIDSSLIAYQKLKESVAKPLKMILLYGKPGTGKSLLLGKLHEDIQASHKVVIFQTPLLDERDFIALLHESIFDSPASTAPGFNQFIRHCSQALNDNAVVVLLDEAQLYSKDQMEKIRLISDTRKIKFVISLHKTEQEEVIAKEHFQTRIWESIELKNATPAELKIYIQKKLLMGNLMGVANMFLEKNIKLIHALTGGNYRDTNKLLYTMFEIYEYYDQNRPSKINYSKISNKFIEMAAIKLELLHV